MDLNFAWYILVYSFLGWVIEAGYCAVRKKQFRNRGFLTVPLIPSYGAAFGVLILVLPRLAGQYGLQALVTLAVVSVVLRLADEFTNQVSRSARWERGYEGILSGNSRAVFTGILISCIYLMVYLTVHPLLIGITLLIPRIVKIIAVTVMAVVSAMDFSAVIYVLRTGKTDRYEKRCKNSKWQNAGQWVSDFIWDRLQKAYPGFGEMSEKEQGDCKFAQGFCLDKLVWVFLISSLLGDLIETVYCGVIDGKWMSRSSVLYGPFSFVWGAGAALLTVALKHLTGKSDRYIFAAGFVIGGVYEYSCSVITEVLFGTVFWDYSSMPLNIGGRTNVLFCFFWGTLAVIWVKEVYPRLSELIESLPHLSGKVITWVVLVFMLCNALLTGAAMARYGTRSVRQKAENSFEEFLDRHYTDDYMEARWKNMRKAAGTGDVDSSKEIVSPMPEEQ